MIRSFMNDIIALGEKNLLSFNNGVWFIKDKIEYFKKFFNYFTDSCLEKIKQIALEILNEDGYSIELNKDFYSTELKKGILETLIILSVENDSFKNCSWGKPRETTNNVIFELFKENNDKIWNNLNNDLPLLAEASPDIFLNSLENILKQSPSPFGNFNNFNDFNIHNLIWGLQCLAWSGEYIARVIYILAKLADLDPSKNSKNNLIQAITDILCIWRPQTTASFKKKKFL